AHDLRRNRDGGLVLMGTFIEVAFRQATTKAEAETKRADRIRDLARDGSATPPQ
ncbi:MAG: hypothetical protein H7Y39_07265, partial [Nitrospiraceae bacterium]|nr:hypothetical protein [Nitrospiraceae bacterium]